MRQVSIRALEYFLMIAFAAVIGAIAGMAVVFGYPDVRQEDPAVTVCNAYGGTLQEDPDLLVRVCRFPGGYNPYRNVGTFEECVDEGGLVTENGTRCTLTWRSIDAN